MSNWPSTSSWRSAVQCPAATKQSSDWRRNQIFVFVAALSHTLLNEPPASAKTWERELNHPLPRLLTPFTSHP